jgi:hypothetical protein
LDPRFLKQVYQRNNKKFYQFTTALILSSLIALIMVHGYRMIGFVRRRESRTLRMSIETNSWQKIIVSLNIPIDLVVVQAFL